MLLVTTANQTFSKYYFNLCFSSVKWSTRTHLKVRWETLKRRFFLAYSLKLSWPDYVSGPRTDVTRPIRSIPGSSISHYSPHHQTKKGCLLCSRNLTTIVTPLFQWHTTFNSITNKDNKMTPKSQKRCRKKVKKRHAKIISMVIFIFYFINGKVEYLTKWNCSQRMAGMWS